MDQLAHVSMGLAWKAARAGKYSFQASKENVFGKAGII
jgi:hypothetical protein